MTQPRPPRPYDAVERRIHDLIAAKARHRRRVEAARLEREVAALGDPDPPAASELASRASDAQVQAILRDIALIKAACEDRG